VTAGAPVLKDLVLIGGGHSHVAVLRQFGMKPLPGVRVTLISRDVDTPYSGMLPGVIAGHYERDEAHIDLEILARFAGARTVFDEAVGLDLENGRVLCRTWPPIAYDLLSINIGSTPSVRVAGSAVHAVPVKPIDRFLDRWRAVSERLVEGSQPRRIAIVGAGAGGVELLLSIQHRLRTLLEREGRSHAHLAYHLFTDGDTILPTYNAWTRRTFRRILDERGVFVHVSSGVVEVTPHRLKTADGQFHDADEVLWTTEASAAPWLSASGLAVDEGGFVRVSATLQSVSHPKVFAAGDVAAMAGHPRPKSGVFAVRQGPPLAGNLRRALLGRPLREYRPQRQHLSLISTGNQYAVASRGPLAWRGAWVWRWKDWIDRRFVREYTDLPDMADGSAPQTGQGAADRQASDVVSAAAMRCGGCGSKIGADVLTRVLERLSPGARGDVVIGLEEPDDAAVVESAGEEALVQSVDFFRAIVDDPFLFGQIAASHALGDIYAMGGEPRSALAIVTLPLGPEPKQEDVLAHLMAGAVMVLKEAGAALVGGHTSEGAELALGFAVSGLVDRSRILRKAGLRAGDRLVLTKAIGTGALFAADMRHRARGRWIQSAIQSMVQPQRAAAECLLAHGATACTDVTGFGLIGHLVEMLRASRVDAEVNLGAVPILPGAEEAARAGFLSSLQPQNARLRRAIVDPPPQTAGDPRFALLFDPQTCGGLLAGLPADRAEHCVADLRARGYEAAAILGVALPSSGRLEMVKVKSEVR
jgi:selenide,water dikinase